jgi:hypothetical protein
MANRFGVVHSYCRYDTKSMNSYVDRQCGPIRKQHIPRSRILPTAIFLIRNLQKSMTPVMSVVMAFFEFSGLVDAEAPIGSLYGGFCGCYAKEESRPNWLALFYSFAKPIIWVVFLFCFSILLLFGPAIQSLADVGPRGDAVFLYLRVVMLFFFTVNI